MNHIDRYNPQVTEFKEWIEIFWRKELQNLNINLRSDIFLGAPWNYWKCLLSWEDSDEIGLCFTLSLQAEPYESDEYDMKVVSAAKQPNDTIYSSALKSAEKE